VQAEQGGNFLHLIRPCRLYPARVVCAFCRHDCPAGLVVG
jgi:hypothetical protein